MNEFYYVIIRVMTRGMLTGVITTLLLVCVIGLIQVRDIKLFRPGDRPNRVASVVAVHFYLLAFVFYASEKRDYVIADSACPVAETILSDGGVSQLEVIHQQAIVNICGVKFFENYSGTKWRLEGE